MKTAEQNASSLALYIGKSGLLRCEYLSVEVTVADAKRSYGRTLGSSGGVDIDVYHSLWATNEKESVFGNIFGYPRLAYAFPFWWSYWFRWAIADRAFEKKGDPAIIVRHPEGSIDLGEGVTMPAQEYALAVVLEATLEWIVRDIVGNPSA